MKKIVTFIFALMTTTALWAYDFKSGDLYYNITSSSEPYTVEVTYQYNWSETNYSSLTTVVIPESVTRNGTTYSVTSIGEMAFLYCRGLTSITIPHSLTSIGEMAFFSCPSLTSITIPESITSIGKEAFAYCRNMTSVVWNAINCADFSYSGMEGPFGDQRHNSAITSFTFGDSVQHIPAYLCYGMTKLTSVTLPNSVTSVGTQAFDECTGLTSPVYNAHCFAYMPSCSGAYAIPEGIKQIAGWAFAYCRSLTSITIPKSVTSIGDEAFRQCSSLTSVVWNAINCTSSAPFDNWSGGSITSITFGDSVQHIPASICNGMTKLTSVTISNSVTSIGNAAFKGCHSLTSPVYNAHCFAYMPTSYEGAYVIPEGIKQIAGSAFYGCSELTSMTIPNSVTSIGEYAFYNCSSLASITIPNSVTGIGGSAFYGCSELTFIESWAEVPPTLKNNVFYNVSATIPVYVSCGTVTAYQSAEGWKEFSNIQEPLAEHSIAVGVNDSIMGTAKVDENTICGAYISATTNHGYHFTQWSDGNTDNPRALQLTQDTTFTAEFAINQYSITTTSSHSERGITQGDTIVNYLENVTISATANYGYHFTKWNDGNTETPRVVQVTDNKNYTAQFDKNIYKIATYCNNNQMGSVNAPTSAEYLDQVTISAIANHGYHFVQWSDGITDNPRTLVLTQDTTFTAEFAISQYSITVTSSHSERGTAQGDTTVNYLENVTISATANHGYHFTKWSDGNTENPRVVQVTDNKNYIAQFDKNRYKITTYCDNQMGSVSAPNNAEYLDQVTISATANHGYHFTQWSDGITANPRTLVLTQDTIFTAEFAQTFYGQCGNDLYWVYDAVSQTITITGSGDMYDYTKSTQPWSLFQGEITELVTSSTTTSIGKYAFEGCSKLGKASLGYTMENIGEYAFADCDKLIRIYCYAVYPPEADANSFANYNGYLYAPCDNLEEYSTNIVFGSFKNFECIFSDEVSTDEDEVVVDPGTNDATISWPTEEDAETYSIVIYKDGEVFCTLTFNSNGQLVNIAFAPGRRGNHPIRYAEATANGYQFTVTGLDESTEYGYNLDVKDDSSKIIKSYEGEFTTNSATGVEDVVISDGTTQKLFRDGQLLIIRDGKTYNAQGVAL